jgi:hypothetical protein
MSVLFESILLFSLAVLIIIMGGLVYYFKKRIVEVEQNNATCLEVVQDVYMQHTKLRNEVNGLITTMQYQYHEQHHHQQHVKTNDELIKIVLSEDDSESDSEHEDINEIDDSDNESESESESDEKREVNQMKNEDKVKIVNVDMSFPEEFEINIDEDLDGEYGEEDSELKSLGQTDQVIVNKVDTTTHISKTELKKLSPSVLKNLLIEKGVNADQVAKMKKNELIDKLAVM